MNRVLILVLIFVSSYVRANSMYDTIQIRNTHINLTVLSLKAKEIRGYAELDVRIKQSTTGISLDLLKMNVDSVVYINSGNWQTLSYTYNDTLLSIIYGKTWQAGDTFKLRIYYHGIPIQDASGWGGFYYSGNYMYNLGVGFAADPHSYGRIWFPCLDDFKTRSTYSFDIYCPKGFRAVCNGLLMSEQHDTVFSRYIYILSQPIPSYLACIAIAPYVIYNSNYKQIPVEIAAEAKDTGKIGGTFQNLGKCMDAYTRLYGPYRFDKIGYSLVPFNGGAMEHATNIALPQMSVDGTTQRETLWAHELSHHWWGDNITCANPGDMFLNEGWACYSEYLFLENIYGKERYDSSLNDLHLYVLQFAHINDGSYLALTRVPHDQTYGTTVYKKGADFLHSLRNIFGDSIFFTHAASFQSDYAFTPVTIEQFRDHYYKYITDTQLVNRTFENLIFNPGFTHFEIVRKDINPVSNGFQTQLTLRQRTVGGGRLYERLPFSLSITDNITTKEFRFEVNGYETQVTLTTSFYPERIILDRSNLFQDAISRDRIKTEKLNDTIQMLHGKMKLYIQGNTSSDIWVDHHWIAPEGNVDNQGIYLHTNRYWTVDGFIDTSAMIDAQILYNGQKTNNDGYLDHLFIRGSEKSIKLYYRPDFNSTWTEWKDYTKNMFNENDKKGNIIIKNIKRGDYTLASDDPILAIYQPGGNEIHVYPNPVSGSLYIDASGKNIDQIRIIDTSGKMILMMTGNNNPFSIDISSLKSGIYIMEIKANQQTYVKKFIHSNNE